MPEKIVIVTRKFDLNADAVILRLRDMGQLPIRVNLDDSGAETNFSLKLGEGSFSGGIFTKNSAVILEDIRAVYWRATETLNFLTGEHLLARSLASAEAGRAWDGLWSSLKCYWMNHPQRARAAGSRITQIEHAVKVGFDVPQTLITSQPPEALDFCGQCGGRLVYRTFGGSITKREISAKQEEGPSLAIFPSLITPEQLKEHSADIAHAPCFFQEYIEKTLEFRVTIIGEKAFVAEIESSAPLRSPWDWQRAESPITVRESSLSEVLLSRCRRLIGDLRLNYGVIDLARTKDGRHFFLEINPLGHFLPLETRLPGLKMVDAIAACLISGQGTPAS